MSNLRSSLPENVSEELHKSNLEYVTALAPHYVKSVLIWRFSDLHFNAFGVNTEGYGVLSIQSKCGKIRTRKIRIRTLFMQ